jgi:glycosyltransferase involved in cell wall biosynthesis
MNQDKPFISVIVPSYNRADLIAKTLQSLQNQHYDNYEIIVVDDGSTDNTEEVVKRVANHRTTYIRKTNAERAAARNFGARMAKGEYVNFFDSDDLAQPNHLLEAAHLIKRYEEPDWFHLGFAWATPEGQVFKEVNNYTGQTLNDLMANGNPLSCNGVFVRKETLLAYQFNEDRALSASEDYELWLRLAARFPLYYTNTITSWVVDHEMRSVRRINGKKLIQRLELLLDYIEKDEKVVYYFRNHFKKIKADSYSYIALHLAESIGFKPHSIKYLIKSLITYPGILSSKRFYAIIKNILIKWQSS